jgi:hypothetical protein
MGRVVNRLDDDWSDNFGGGCSDLWNPPDWAHNQWLALDKAPHIVRESRRAKTKAVPSR